MTTIVDQRVSAHGTELGSEIPNADDIVAAAVMFVCSISERALSRPDKSPAMVVRRDLVENLAHRVRQGMTADMLDQVRAAMRRGGRL